MTTSLSALALLVTGPEGSHQVLLGSDEAAYRHAFAAFVRAWGEPAVWYDDQAKVLGSDGGVMLARWRARVLGAEPRFGLIVLAGRQAVGVYLVDDTGQAERAVAALEREGISFELVALEALPVGGPADDLPLDGSVRVRHGEPLPVAPRARLSDEFCRRCWDHPLYAEPLFDAIGADGGRICLACARLDLLRSRREAS